MEELVLVYDEMRKLSEKKRLTAKDKSLIEELAQTFGVTLNKNCPNCYRDAALQIALANKPRVEPQDGEYELCDDIDITIESYKFGRLHVCAKDCTADNARKWIAAGVPLRFFKKYPHDHNE